MTIFEPILKNNRLMLYNWQQPDWTLFQYDSTAFDAMAARLTYLVGQSTGILKSLSPTEQNESLITLLVKEALKTSAIEGEMISRADLISSIKKNLGYATPSVIIRDKRSEGIAELLLKSRNEFDQDLDDNQLFDWHRLLMRGNYSVAVGTWRSHTEPMQVISGAIGKEQVHFEAPPSHRVAAEMAQFIRWFNDSKPTGAKPIHNAIIRAAIAHLYFETIHPFEDGNGRIGRVIAEKSLAQSLNQPLLMSLSTTIEADKSAYYQALKVAQRTNLIADWITYFGNVILQAQENFIQNIAFSLKKTRFFDTKKTMLNDRQTKVLARMLEEDEEFEGGMNAKKYQSIAKTSKATATRDLQDLVEKQILVSKGSARATNYQVNFEA
jgi:Fic family protein